MTPQLIHNLLASPAFQLLARVLLTLVFWLAGIAKLADFQGAVAEMAALGLPAPAFIAGLTIATQLIGSALIIAGGRLVWLGAGALGVFTALTIPIAHAFWTFEGHTAIEHLRVAAEHVSVIGGLIVVSILHAILPQRSR